MCGWPCRWKSSRSALNRGNDVERAASILARARPLVEARGSAMAVADFYRCVSKQHLRERGYRVDPEVVEDHRRAVKAAQAVEGTKWDLGNPETVRISAMFLLGTALTWYGDLAEARQVLYQALDAVDRVGTPNGRGLVLLQLAITAWRQGDVELVRELAPQARAAAGGGAQRDQVAAATAALEAWVAWRDHRTEQVISLGAEAMELTTYPVEAYDFRFHWLAFFPLASAYLDLGQTERAVDAVRQMLEPTQAQLPDELEAAVQGASEAWDQGQPETAGRLVGEAVALAVKLRYA